MKKVLALALALVMALTFVACGSSSSSTQAGSSTAQGSSDSLSVIWWGNQTRNERTQAALDLYSEQNGNVAIDAQFAEWGDYWNKLATSAAAHSLPDVIQMDYKYLSQYVTNNLLVDLTPYVESGELDVSGIDPGILEAGSVDGKLYAVCIGVNAPALLYNKTLLEENGIEIKDNMTMDEFIAVSKEVYEKTGVKTNVSYGSGENFIDYTLRGQGIQLYDGNKFGVESAADFEPYFEIYENGIAEGWMTSPEVFAERAVGSIEQDPLVFGTSADQRSWCFFAYSNQLSAVQSAADADGIEIGVTTWPSQDPVKSNHLRPSQFFSVTVDSKNPQGAASLLDFWTNSVECNEILLAERGIPASAQTADALTPQLDSMQQLVTTYINDVVTPNCSAISPPAPESSAEVLKLYDSLQEQVCYKQITAAQAAERLYTEGNAILGG